MLRTARDRKYNQLHEELAKEYLTTPESIKIIRSLIIGLKLSKIEVLNHIEKKDESASETIRTIMQHMSDRSEAKRWLSSVSTGTLEEMLAKDIER